MFNGMPSVIISVVFVEPNALDIFAFFGVLLTSAIVNTMIYHILDREILVVVAILIFIISTFNPRPVLFLFFFVPTFCMFFFVG